MHDRCGEIVGGYQMWMRRTAAGQKLFAAFLSALTASGCAIHPLPDDVAHISTYNIVRQIRCETRAAIIDSFLSFLTDERNNRLNSQHFKKVDDASRAIGLQAQADYEADRDSIRNFKPAKLTGFARNVVELLFHTGIAYNYDLKGLEIENVDPEANFIRPVPISTLVSLGLKGNFDRQRQNERSFTITDNAGDLVTKVPASYCTKFIAERNFVYPIAGKVGMERMVQDFLQLTLFGNLSGDGKADVTKVAGPPTMVDQLQFQTVIGGSATPKVTFLPIGRAFQVADASLGVAASRTDTHQLTVGLYLDTTGAKEIGGVRTALFGGLITASGGSAERGAAAAVEQFLQQKLFKPTIVIQQP
jgi:hypothetical protein